MTRRSLLKRLLLSLALGAATTIAVAWALVMWSPWNDPRVAYGMLAPRGSDISSIAVSQRWQPGATLRTISSTDVDWSTLSWNPPASASHIETLTPSQIDTTWGAAHRVLIRSEELSRVEDARGWPCLCLYSWMDFVNRTSGGTSLRIRGEDPWGYDFTVLPTLPIWRGLALNSALYAALWLLPLTLPSLLITHLRRRRGHCPKCNYNLQRDLTAGCSECGWNKLPAPPP